MKLCAALLLAFLAGPTEVEEIRELLDREMYKTARPRLDAYLARQPDSPEGQALLYEFCVLDERWEAAEAAARRAIELDTRKTPRYWMLWGRARFEQGREEEAAGKSPETAGQLFAQAETGFRRALEYDPDHPDAVWWIGWTKEWRSDYSLAEQYYRRQIDEHPERPGGYLRLARLQAIRADRKDDGKTPAARKLRSEAIATFDLGLEKAGEDAELLYHRARVLISAGDVQGAVVSLRRSVLADGGYRRSWTLLQETLNDVDAIFSLAMEVLEKHPTAVWPARFAGTQEFQRDPARGEEPHEKYERTLTIVLPALEVHGDHGELYRLAFHSAQALIGEGPKKAPNARVGVDAFKRIHDAYAWSGDAANNLGYHFREVPKYDDSLAWYLKSVERAPENQDILNDTGLMYLFHFPKRKAEGLPYFLKTVALVKEGDQKPERGYWDALENLCKHYWEVDRQPEKVIEYAKMRYVVTKGVKPYNMSQVAARWAEKARKALGR
jgi:tetratricopeptide (TPR) repeat protein